MKKRIFALAGACLLTLAACAGTAPYSPPGGPGPVNECGPGPGPNGLPCP